MSRFTHAIARKLAFATLMGATFLGAPLVSARAETTAKPPQHATTKPNASKDATSNKSENVEQRITSLRASLKITPEEEPKWNAVAQAMRENAASMDKLIAEKRAQAPKDMTAVDDLKTYQEFAQMHLDGLKNLNSAFKDLYDSMPTAQKKNADDVFEKFGRQTASR